MCIDSITEIDLKKYWFFIPFLFLSACAGGFDSGIRTSHDTYGLNNPNAPETYEPQEAMIQDTVPPVDSLDAPTDQAPAAEVPLERTHRGSINGVAYVINKELSQDSLSPGESDSTNSKEERKRAKPQWGKLQRSEAQGSELDFPELKSSFDANDNKWRPRHGYDIPVVENAKVDRWIHTFTGPLRSNFERWLGRASLYAPMIESILQSYDLPSDLIYLAMIESGFNLNAYSRAAAAGPWQFIRSTGHMYGLQTGSFVDERRDIEKATRAAAEHLKDLYAHYGDWNLAFAAYNAGAGGVDRAIRASGTHDYWQMTSGRRHYLRRETEDYVPRIYAAAIIAKHYKEYGFSSDIFNEPYNIETVSVPDSTDISAVAQCAEVSVEDIRLLNPSLVMGITPPGQSYSVIIPDGTADTFRKNYANLPPSERVKMITCSARRYDTLTTVAKRYGVNRNLLAQANSLPLTARLHPGTRLVIPRKSFSAAKTISPSDKNLNTNSADYVMEDANSVDLNSTPSLQKVQKDVVATNQRIVHSVRRGETLWDVSLKYRVTVAQLKQWNGLRGNGLRPNQKLVIYAGRTGTSRKVAVIP